MEGGQVRCLGVMADARLPSAPDVPTCREAGVDWAMGGSLFDVGIMLAMGLLGFGLERRNIPLGPVVLGTILAGPLEERFIQAVTGAGVG